MLPAQKDITALNTLPSVAIVGAGISGLTLALSLCNHGIQSHILEKKDQLSGQGFGIQISPNASRILKKIGVLNQLEDLWIEPKDFVFHSGSTLTELRRIPCGYHARNNWGGAYGVLKRDTLQKILLSNLQEQPLAKLHLSTHITQPDFATISQTTSQKPDLLVGADGLHSSIRQYVDKQPATFSGNIVLRCIIPQNDVPEFIDPQSVNLFFGPNSHLVAYPLREDNTINIVITSDKHLLKNIPFLQKGHSSYHNSHKKWFLKHLAGWHREIRELIERTNKTYIYPLFECKCTRWHNHQDTVLIGDAAHTLLPFAAQGANLAIEDAYILSKLLSEKKISEAISTYQYIRTTRINMIRARTKLNQKLFHMRNVASICRDIGLRLGHSKLLYKNLDWIYKYEVPETI
ncbi:MAG: monooxygenase [Candidatus Liberibacter solanacearum]